MVIKLGSPLRKLWPQEALKRSLAWFEAAAYEYLQKQRRSSNVPTAQIDPRRQTIVCVSLRITNQAKIIRSTTHPLTIRRITEKGASYTHQKQRYIYIYIYIWYIHVQSLITHPRNPLLVTLDPIWAGWNITPFRLVISFQSLCVCYVRAMCVLCACFVRAMCVLCAYYVRAMCVLCARYVCGCVCYV